MFFITCFHQVQTEKSFNGTGFDFDAQRCFGFYENFKWSDEALKNNTMDMHECLYDFACIEEMIGGIHPMVQNIWWYQYDSGKDGFYPIDEPPLFAKQICNFALG